MSTTDGYDTIAYDTIAALFHQRIDSIVGAVDTMAAGLQSAASSAMQAVMEDRKLILIGCGDDAVLAQYAASLFRTPADDTPPVPAIAVSSDTSDDPDAKIWRELRTLSRDGDVIIAIETGEHGNTIAQSLVVAQERNLVPIILSEQMAPNATGMIFLQESNPLQRRELALMALHTLRELIRRTWLGE